MKTEISRTIRHLAPAHYTLKVESFSSISEIEKYESRAFEAGGYNWKLLFYPNGSTKNDGESHISLYLEIVMTEALPVAWEVNANLKFFVHNQVKDNYLVIQDNANGGVKRFCSTKKTWGLAKLLPHVTFKNSSNGYLVSDACLFGAEVVVLKNSGLGESVSLVKAPLINSPTFTWEIEKFSGLDKAYTTSAVFSVGERNWYLRLHPRGFQGYEYKYLALFLYPSNWKSQVQRKAGMHAEFKLRVVDQINGKHKEHKCSFCFGALGEFGTGARSLVTLEDLHERSNGFIVKDGLTVEVEFLSFTETKYFGDIPN